MIEGTGNFIDAEFNKEFRKSDFNLIADRNYGSASVISCSSASSQAFLLIEKISASALPADDIRAGT